MIHENIRVLWRAYHTHDTAFSLKIVFAVERKVVKDKIRSSKVAITFVAPYLLVCLSNNSFTAFIPTAFGILVYKGLTSKDIN